MYNYPKIDVTYIGTEELVNSKEISIIKLIKIIKNLEERIIKLERIQSENKLTNTHYGL
jgi:hypothetical protein